MSHQVISSRNLFIDTSSDLNGSRGDDITLQLGSDSISAGSGQQIKLTLNYFCMYRNYYSINDTNNKFRLTTTNKAEELELTKKNYSTYGEIVQDFANTLSKTLLSHAIAAGSTATQCDATLIKPNPSDSSPSDTGDRIMSFTLVFNTAHDLGSPGDLFSIQSFAPVGESYAILGGNRINDNTSIESSLITAIASSTEMTVQGYYPMQRSTDSHICLRCNLPNTNIETASLSSATGPYNSHTLSSNILAMIPNDFEFTKYTAGTNNEFFISLTTPQMSAIRLFITDNKNRPLGREAGVGTKTAAGTGSDQSTLGNLSFMAIIRVDVVQITIPNMLSTKPVTNPIPARLGGVLDDLSSC